MPLPNAQARCSLLESELKPLEFDTIAVDKTVFLAAACCRDVVIPFPVIYFIRPLEQLWIDGRGKLDFFPTSVQLVAVLWRGAVICKP